MDALRRRLSTAVDDEPKHARWPPDHPHAFSIGDVEVRKGLPDAAKLDKDDTATADRLIFGLLDWPKKGLKVEDVKKSEDAPKDKKKDKKKEPKPVRKVFVSFKVKRVSDIDNVKEEFRIKFHIYFNWVPTYAEYMSYIKAKREKTLEDWEPRWYPHLEFMNQIEKIGDESPWESYPDEGRFRIQKLKTFFDELCDDKNIYDPDDHNLPVEERGVIGQFNWNDCYFIRAKFDIEMVCSEELELQSFPFDCQDLSVIMREGSRDINISFLPEMRKKYFASIDPRYSVIEEWDMESARLEFGASSADSSRSSSTYPMIILRLKMKRRWQVFMWNVVLLVLCIECLAITCFALDVAEDAPDRLGLSITLVLTAVAFLHVVKSGLPNVPYLTFLDFYVMSGYVFLMAIMLETAIISKWEVDVWWDNFFMLCCIGYQIIYHIIFFFYSFKVRQEEKMKLAMDSDSIEDEVNQTRPGLSFDYREGSRQGKGNRLLFFRAKKKEA